MLRNEELGDAYEQAWDEWEASGEAERVGVGHGGRPRAGMRRGEIWLTDLEPVQGAEANKRRPAVIVSNDRAKPGLRSWGVEWSLWCR